MKKIFILIFFCFLFHMQAQAATNMDETPESQFLVVNNVDRNPDLNVKATQLQTPVAMYEYLRNNADYALYQGARSGSINSFLSLRGNDVDLSATLIAMLRTKGYPARFAVGIVTMPSAKVMNWLKVENADLAASLMKDQGIQNVTISTDKSTINFDHVWVEALIPLDSYRGTKVSTTSCVATPTNCNWVPLDPSFKQYDYKNTTLDPHSTLSFDYSAYYNALKNNDSLRRDKNPLQIYQEQISAWLRTNSPGNTLDDIPDFKDITVESNDILPASPPFLMVNTPRRYNSVEDHDAAVPSAESKKWAKNASLSIYLSATITGGGTVNLNLGGGKVSLIDLATKRLTMTTEIVGGIPNMVVRLDGVEIARPLSGGGTIVGYTPTIGNPFSLTVNMDGPPSTVVNVIDTTISATYQAAIGGYYLVATGGETSNWSQVHRAASQLLTANQQYKIVFKPADLGINGCDATTKIGCMPYVDANLNGWDAADLKLLDNKSALDDLTGGMLNVAATQYYAKIQDAISKVDALNKVKTPIEGFLGVVSSTYQAEYIDSTAFSVLPGGLLIDMKGIQIGGSWRIDQPAIYSNSQFELIGHIASSFEHEVWQELTGYDAISTVRGIQLALANNATLINPKKNTTTDTLSSSYSAFGFSTIVPTGFTYAPFNIGTTSPSSWTNTVNGSQFRTFQSAVDLTTSTLRQASATYSFVSATSGLYGWSKCVSDQINNVNALANGLYTGSTCSGVAFTNATKASIITTITNDWNSNIVPNIIGQNYFDYFDRNKGFSLTGRVFRTTSLANDSYDTSKIVGIRDDLSLRDLTKAWVEYVLPSKLSIGPNYRFAVNIRKAYDATNNNMSSASYEIQNMQGVAAGGGYVSGVTVLSPKTSITGVSATALPTFNNATLNTMNTVAEANNNTIKTPSTADPVSTVTGNNYHDETDVVIKGRGLNIAFTRTYNSTPSSTKLDKGLGFGWVHSYGMRLKSNDYGKCPDCTTAQDPLNGNNKTASVTYTDERGGDHNYLVSETTFTATSPAGEFDSLAFNTPSSGLHTITFRSGVKYIFEGAGNINTAINVSARLKQIIDPYGNQLNFTYDATTFPGKLTSVTDNLAIAGRTGLTFTYDVTNHLQKVTDWSGRNWNYVVNANNQLTSFTNPLSQKISYTYAAGTNNLNQIIMPLQRNGKDVQTVFKYYQNGKTFNYANALGDTETLDYDLFRKTTRVTDPRGGIRTYEYDQSGRMTKLTEPDGGSLFFDNNPDGLRYRKFDALGYPTQYSFKGDKTFNTASDTFGNVTREQDPLLQNVDTTYGVYDQVATVKDKRGSIKTNAYYTATSGCGYVGKLQSVTLSTLTINGVATNNVLLEDYCWNTDGTLKTKNEYVDAGSTSRKRITNFTYQSGTNGLNLSQITITGTNLGAGSPASITKIFAYDSLGRKTLETLQRRTSATNSALINITTTYEYDALDRVTAAIDNLGNRMETVYDANGKVYQQIAKYKQAGGGFIARTLSTRTYDAADRMVADTNVEGSSTQYLYDEAGNVINTMDANGHVTNYEYDEMNRRTAVIDANGSRTATNYDQAGRVTAVTNANSQTVSNTLDKLGRTLSATDAKGYSSTFTYDANNNLICA